MSPKVHLRHLNCHRFSTTLTTFNPHFSISIKLIHFNNIEENSQLVERYILPIMNMDSAVTNEFYTTKSDNIDNDNLCDFTHKP
jgi:hypothetical protein